MSRRWRALLAGGAATLLIAGGIAFLWGRDRPSEVPLVMVTPTPSATATPEPTATPVRGRTVTLYHGDTDEVSEEANGTTVVCDFHIRGTIFDYRAGNRYGSFRRRRSRVKALSGTT